MKVSNAWSAGYSGAGIVIAVLDDGLQTDHPDLVANVVSIKYDIYYNKTTKCKKYKHISYLYPIRLKTKPQFNPEKSARGITSVED